MENKLTIAEIKSLVESRTDGNDMFYCVTLEWHGCDSGEVVDCHYHTDKELAENMYAKLKHEGGRLYANGLFSQDSPLSVWVTLYEARIEELVFEVDDEHFVERGGYVVLSEDFEKCGTGVDDYIEEVEIGSDELADYDSGKISSSPLMTNHESGIERGDEEGFDVLSWTWNRRKFKAYGGLRTTKYVDDYPLRGLGIEWVDPNGKRHEIFTN